MKIRLFFTFSNAFAKLFWLKFTSVFLFLSFASFAQNTSNEGYQITSINVEPYIQVIKRTGKVNFRHTINLSFKTTSK